MATYHYLVGAWESIPTTLASWFDSKWNLVPDKTAPAKPKFYDFTTQGLNAPSASINGIYDHGVFFNDGGLSKYPSFNHISDDVICYARNIIIDVNFTSHTEAESVIMHMNDIVQKFFPNQSVRIEKSDGNNSAIACFADLMRPSMLVVGYDVLLGYVPH